MSSSTPTTAARRSSDTAIAGPAPIEDLGVKYPRVVIQYCTKCKWMLRAAYYAQELLSTFSSSPSPDTPYLAEVSLQPGPSGTFTVTLFHLPPPVTTTQLPEGEIGVLTTLLWDRKTDGGFPETKELKRRVRDVIDPGRGLGHVDRVEGKSVKEKDGVGVDSAKEVETDVKVQQGELTGDFVKEGVVVKKREVVCQECQ